MSKPFAIHPGEILLTEFLEPMGLRSYRLARQIGVPLPRVNDVVLGKRSISADTAFRQVLRAAGAVLAQSSEMSMICDWR